MMKPRLLNGPTIRVKQIVHWKFLKFYFISQYFFNYLIMVLIYLCSLKEEYVHIHFENPKHDTNQIYLEVAANMDVASVKKKEEKRSV